MTIVTTSRKPVPELRSLARDFAFATGCRYILRGKMGLPDLHSLDPARILFFKRGGYFYLRFDDHGRTTAEFVISSMARIKREGAMIRGIEVGDPSIYERLAPYVTVKLSEGSGGSCVFDGTRSRRYLLRLIIHEA
jgi:U3 small nucleolar ribonucleoprotein protein IMP4